MSLNRDPEVVIYSPTHERSSADLPLNEIIELVSENTDPVELLTEELLERYGTKKIEDLIEYLLFNETAIMRFDGVDDYIEWENKVLDINKCFTLDSRVFLDSSIARTDLDCYICSINDSFGRPTMVIQIQAKNNQFAPNLIFWDKFNEPHRLSGPPLQVGSWNEIEIRKKRRLIRFRVNQEISFRVSQSQWGRDFQTLNVGRGPGPKYFKGEMEYFKLRDEGNTVILSTTTFSEKGIGKEIKRDPKKVGITFQNKVEAGPLKKLLSELIGRISNSNEILS